MASASRSRTRHHRGPLRRSRRSAVRRLRSLRALRSVSADVSDIRRNARRDVGASRAHRADQGGRRRAPGPAQSRLRAPDVGVLGLPRMRGGVPVRRGVRQDPRAGADAGRARAESRALVVGAPRARGADRPAVPEPRVDAVRGAVPAVLSTLGPARARRALGAAARVRAARPRCARAADLRPVLHPVRSDVRRRRAARDGVPPRGLHHARRVRRLERGDRARAERRKRARRRPARARLLRRDHDPRGRDAARARARQAQHRRVRGERRGRVRRERGGLRIGAQRVRSSLSRRSRVAGSRDRVLRARARRAGVRR